MTSWSRLLCILTFFPIAGPNLALPPLLGSVPSCSPIVLRKMLCSGVMHGVILFGVISFVMFMFGVLPTLPLNGDLLALLYDFLIDLLLDFLDFVFFLLIFPFDLLRLLPFMLFLPLLLPLDIERRSLRNLVLKADLADLSTALKFFDMRFEHFLANSFTLLYVLSVSESPRFMTDLVRDFDFDCARDTFLFRDLDFRGPWMTLFAAG